MPDEGEGWLPIAEIRLIFRHLVVTIAIAVALYVGAKAFGILAPMWAEDADLIDGFMTICLLAVMGIKLVAAFAGGTRALAIA